MYLLFHLNLTEIAYISTKLFLVQYNRMNNVHWDYTFKQVVLDSDFSLAIHLQCDFEKVAIY